MKRPHPLYKLHIGFEVDNDGWLAYCQERPGVSAHGPTREAALAELETAYELAMDVAKESGWTGWGPSEPSPPDGEKLDSDGLQL